MLEKAIAGFMACKITAFGMQEQNKSMQLVGNKGLFAHACQATSKELPAYIVSGHAKCVESKGTLDSEVLEWKYTGKKWRQQMLLAEGLVAPTVVCPGSANQKHSDFAIAVDFCDEYGGQGRPGLILVQCKTTMPESKNEGSLDAVVVEDALERLVKDEGLYSSMSKAEGPATCIRELGVAQTDVVFVMLADRNLKSLMEKVDTECLNFHGFKGHVLVVSRADLLATFGKPFGALLHFLRDPQVAALRHLELMKRPRATAMPVVLPVVLAPGNSARDE